MLNSRILKKENILSEKGKTSLASCPMKRSSKPVKKTGKR